MAEPIELDRQDFEMFWDDKTTFPFMENESGIILAYGHADPDELVRQIKAYDAVSTGKDEPYEGFLDTKLVRHVHAVASREKDADDYQLLITGITANDEHAFPMTLVIR